MTELCNTCTSRVEVEITELTPADNGINVKGVNCERTERKALGYNF